MKLTQIFGIVVLIHVGVICLLLVQPGCQSTQADPQPSATLSQTAAPSAPTTPASPQPSTSGQLDPAFNANLTPAPAGRTEPQRPTAPTRPAASSPTPAATQDNQPVLQPLRPVTNGQASTQSYTVQAGDNLTVIARRHNITVAELRAANNLTNDRINVGQQLNIPVTDSAPAVANGATATPAAATATATTTRSYTVRAGDTLSRIAQREGTTVAALRSANRLTSDNIRVGQELVIPVTGAPAPTAAVTTTPSATAQPAATGNNLTYVVQPGDSPTTIARQLGVEVNELMRANNITDPRRLRVGQTLVVPGRTQPATQAAASPSPTAARPAQTTPTQMVPQASRPATLPAGNRQPSPLDLLEDEDNLPVIDFVEVDE